MTYFLDLRADSVGGIPAAEVTPTRDGTIVRIEDLAAAAQGRHLLLATHGFNVDRRHGMDSLGQWETLLTLDDTLFVGLLWPGDSRWLPVLDYPFEGDEAITSGQMLGPYLDRWFGGAVSLSFASHSLGARMVLETIRNMRRRVRHVALMAGAINDDCLVHEYGDAAARAEAISVLASTGDDVLALAFPAGNFFAGIITRGHPYCHAALGHQGPDLPYPANLRAGWQIPDDWQYGHGDYLPEAVAATPPFPPPVAVPPRQTPPLPGFPDRKPCWSAGWASTRMG